VEYEEYKKTLKELKLTMKKFSTMINLSYATVIKWGKDGRAVPSWVETWLELYRDKKNLELEIEKLKDEDCEEYKALAKALQGVINKDK